MVADWSQGCVFGLPSPADRCARSLRGSHGVSGHGAEPGEWDCGGGPAHLRRRPAPIQRLHRSGLRLRAWGNSWGRGEAAARPSRDSGAAEQRGRGGAGAPLGGAVLLRRLGFVAAFGLGGEGAGGSPGANYRPGGDPGPPCCWARARSPAGRSGSAGALEKEGSGEGDDRRARAISGEERGDAQLRAGGVRWQVGPERALRGSRSVWADRVLGRDWAGGFGLEKKGK